MTALCPECEGSLTLNNVIAGRIANRLDLRGTNCTLDAACASSLAALKMGAQELWLGEADLVVAGGADALCDPLGYMSFAKCSALSKTDDCRPFSSGADGTIISEGVGLVVLERLADAERNGRRIYAVIRGIGSSSDGRGTAIYAPSAEGQALAMRRAYRSAGVSPDTVELLEAHGTGTPAGEVAEDLVHRLGLGRRSQAFNGVLDQRCEIHRLNIETQFAALYSSGIEQILN